MQLVIGNQHQRYISFLYRTSDDAIFMVRTQRSKNKNWY